MSSELMDIILKGVGDIILFCVNCTVACNVVNVALKGAILTLCS